MPNRLGDSSSPYLLQHADNPVDWYPWGAEALGRAKEEDRPIFLSVGYSACHWCHVMEHESFENVAIASLLNANFVCIKVDREEYPDIDQIYMRAVQLLTGRGGWPMSVFLTPNLEPFYGGTYWPPTAKMGMPGFPQVLEAVADAWRNRREQASQQAKLLAERISQIDEVPRSEIEPHIDTFLQAARRLEQAGDLTFGGFGQAPKFPHAIDLQLLLRAWHRTGKSGLLDLVRLTLDKMAAGGIHDHIGGGFARYSVDERWLVPHFEKMLYDNALLAGVYLDVFTATKEPFYAGVTKSILDYILKSMTDPEGGFYSAEDADSEGEEGRFYVWTKVEVLEILGTALGNRFCDIYDISEEGNFEGKNIPNLPRSLAQVAKIKGWDLEELIQEMTTAKALLRDARAQRIRPLLDDKVLVSWNALMIDAMARSGAVFKESRYLEAAAAAADFALTTLRRKDGRLQHMWRQGRSSGEGFLDDYAYLINALVTLYESTFEERWIESALELVSQMRALFADTDKGGFYFTSTEHQLLFTRQVDLMDSSVPSGNGMAATALVRLGKLCGRVDFVEMARDIVLRASGLLEQSPMAAGQLLVALDMLIGPLTEIAILGKRDDPNSTLVVEELRNGFIPNKVLAFRDRVDPHDGCHALDPIYLGRRMGLVPPTIFLCEKFVCQAPIQGKKLALEAWERLKRPGGRSTDS
jgi:uncharacterized protein